MAWLSLALSALATLGALWGVLALAVTPAATVDAAVDRVAQDTSITHLIPAPYLFMLHHVNLVSVVRLGWWTTLLATSIGVLRRKEWARRAFVAVLGIDIVLVIAGLVVSESMLVRIGTQIAAKSGSRELPPGMGSGMATGGLLGIGLIAILLWLLFTFRSARVRADFASAGRADAAQ